MPRSILESEQSYGYLPSYCDETNTEEGGEKDMHLPEQLLIERNEGQPLYRRGTQVLWLDKTAISTWEIAPGEQVIQEASTWADSQSPKICPETSNSFACLWPVFKLALEDFGRFPSRTTTPCQEKNSDEQLRMRVVLRLLSSQSTRLSSCTCVLKSAWS